MDRTPHPGQQAIHLTPHLIDVGRSRLIFTEHVTVHALGNRDWSDLGKHISELACRLLPRQSCRCPHPEVQRGVDDLGPAT